MKKKSLFILAGLIFILIFNLSGKETPQNWKAKTLWESKEKIQRVIVEDINPKHKGDEIISVAANGEVVFTYKSSGKWVNEILWDDAESLTGAAAGELDAAHPGKEIIVGGNTSQYLTKGVRFMACLSENSMQPIPLRKWWLWMRMASSLFFLKMVIGNTLFFSKTRAA